MIRICGYCKEKMGEKEPFEDKRETVGICPECFPKVEKEIERYSISPSVELLATTNIDIIK